MASYRKNKVPLVAFFGAWRLNEIHIGHIRSYQVERGKKAGHYLLNAECSCLGMVLDEAGLWEEIKAKYKPRRVPKRGSGHSLSRSQEEKLREVAQRKPKWRLACHCMNIMLATTMNWRELQYLRRRHVDLEARILSVCEAKNEGREREIPLNPSAADSFAWLIERWEKLGGTSPDQFLLPKRPKSRNGPWDFEQPMTSIKTAFRKIRQEAGLPKFRIHDCRVQAITKLLANPRVSPQVAKEIAGHISQAMQDRYSIQQYDTKLDALRCLDGVGPANRPQAIEMAKKAPVPEKKPPDQDALIQEFAAFMRWRRNSA